MSTAPDAASGAANANGLLNRLTSGTTSRFATHLKGQRIRNNESIGYLDQVERHPLGMVPMTSLCERLAKAKSGKAMGPLHEAPEACHLFAQQLARIYDPLVIKSCLTLTGPLQASGAKASFIPKDGRASHSAPSNRRVIMLANQMPKCLGASLRPAVTAYAGGAAMAGQCGLGWGGFGCDVAHVTGRALISAAIAQKTSHALIFVDIKAAFDSTVQQLALLGDLAFESIVKVVSGMKFTTEEAHEIATDSLRIAEWGGAPEHLPHTIAMMSHSAWATEGRDDIAIQTVGVAAGTPLADVVFGVVGSRIARTIRRRLEEQGLLVSFPTSGVASILGIVLPPQFHDGYLSEDTSYVDDSVYFQSARADLLVERTARTMSIIHVTYAEHGFTLNMKREKTSVIFSFIGPQSKEVSISMIDVLSIPYMARGVLIDLPVVDEYRHLGGWMSKGSGVMNDVVKKASIIRTAAKPIRRHVLANRDVDVQTRLALAKALVFSRGLFMAGAWPELLQGEHKFIHGAILTVLRTVGGEERWKHSQLTDAQVVAAVGAEPPIILLRHKRMKLFISIVVRRYWPALVLLTAGMSAPRSWLGAIERDFAWLEEDVTIRQWVQRIDLNFKGVLKLISIKCKAASAAAVVVHAAPAAFDAVELGMHVCGTCGTSLGTAKDLAVHRANAHGHTRLACRYAAADASCWVCLGQYGGRAQLVEHLCRAPVCMLNRLVFTAPMSLDAAAELAAADRESSKVARKQGRRSSYSGIPRRQAHGPARPLLLPTGIGRHSPNIVLRNSLVRAIAVNQCAKGLGGITSENADGLKKSILSSPSHSELNFLCLAS